jgi:hypothetical protein
MKTSMISKQIMIGFSLAAMTALGACSSLPGGGNKSNGNELAQSGPTVLDVKTSPDVFGLNQNLAPVSQAQVVANIKDFQGQVQDVKLQFLHVPLVVQMKQVTPSTWVADLTQEELKQLAVNGHTMKYEANVVAKDTSGQLGVSKSPIEISVKAPDVTSSG